MSETVSRAVLCVISMSQLVSFSVIKSINSYAVFWLVHLQCGHRCFGLFEALRIVS